MKTEKTQWTPKVGETLDFLEDGKASRRKAGSMKVVDVVKGLDRAREITYESDETSPEETLFDWWRRTLAGDIESFARIGYKVFDWGCETFVVCEPDGRKGLEVAFAPSRGGWYTLDDGEYNGRLAGKGPGVSGTKARRGGR